MRRLNVISILLVTSLILVCGYYLNSWRVQAKGVRLNVKDLPEHNLLIISPTDSSFSNEVMKLASGKSDKEKHLIEALKPFSIFVKNRSKRDVVAYSIRWDVMQADGTVKTHHRTYAEPGALMGRDTERMSEENRNAGLAIRANSDRYISIASSINPAQGKPVSVHTGSGGANAGDAEQIQRLGMERNEAALIDALSAQLAQAESLTVSLDAAIFDDGTFVGLDSFGYFPQIQAAINAKRDLLQESELAVREGEPFERMFNRIEALTKESDETIRADSTPEDYYRLYKKEFAGEILRMRANIGDDKKTMWYVVQPLRRGWPKLRKS